ncbi:MAG: nucleoside-triphosphatase [Eubacteriales bacterium]
MKRHIFLTGLRGVGKSTVLTKVLGKFQGKIGGFQTIWRENSLYLMDFGEKNVTADRLVAGRSDLVRWRDSQKFDHIAPQLLTESDVIVMDELGFFEGNSPRFQQWVFQCLDGETPVIGVIKPQHTDFLDKIRNHPQVEVIWVTETNRRGLGEEQIWAKCINGTQK